MRARREGESWGREQVREREMWGENHKGQIAEAGEGENFLRQSLSLGVQSDRRVHWLMDNLLVKMAETKEELESLLMRVKEESEKSWLKTQHSKN